MAATPAKTARRKATRRTGQGGSSSLFSLVASILRQDEDDMIFGGAGTDISRNNTGDGSHDNDSDMILGDNGNIFRLVGTNGVYGGAFLRFAYDLIQVGCQPVQPVEEPAYLAGVDFEKLGLPALGHEPTGKLNRTVQHGIYQGFIAPTVLYAALGTVIFMNKRRGKVSADEKGGER